jgi:tetratricopeptide (TPR) repeat protein
VDSLEQGISDALASAERIARSVSELPGFEGVVGAGAVLIALLVLLLLARRSAKGADRPEENERKIQLLIARNEYGRAGDMRMSQGQFDKALALFLNGGNMHKAALCYLALKQPAKAAQMFVQMGRQAEAAHHFQTAGDWRSAAECLHALGSDREAAELYERSGDLAKAANLMRTMGDAENAARLFERAGMGAEAAAALLVAHGREPQALRRAGELFLRASEVRRAAECFAAAGDWVRAAEIFEDSGEYMLAAQAFERASDWERAGAAYERSGAMPEARTNYERAGDLVKAARVATEMGSLLDAARCFYELGSYERAIETLQQVPGDAPQARDAKLLLGRIFLEKGLFQRAREMFQALVSPEPRSQDDLQILYYLADVDDRAGEGASAIGWLERIVEVDEGFSDAAARLERIREKTYGESSPAPGYFDNRYELREEIGRGGMGVVYLANDTELGRRVAIKFLPGELAINDSAVTMFRQEARAAAAMNHPNVVTIYDVGVLGGRPCIVMEYVPGKTVREVMRARGRGSDRALPTRRVAEIARDLCIALGYAHSSGVIHRDVKPGNILISDTGEVKLMDFGISKVLEAGRGDGLTQAKGTPQYMPPEQILGREVDGRTDLYALGISMFEMVAGRRPFVGEDVVDQQLHSAIPDPREINEDIPEEFVELIRKACAKKPDDRFESAREMANSLSAFIATLGAA